MGDPGSFFILLVLMIVIGVIAVVLYSFGAAMWMRSSDSDPKTGEVKDRDEEARRADEARKADEQRQVEEARAAQREAERERVGRGER